MKIPNTIGHLSAAVQVLEQAAYAARAEMDPIVVEHAREIEAIIGRIQNVIATVEAEKRQLEEELEKAEMKHEAQTLDAIDQDERDLQRAEQSFYDREEGPREGEAAARNAREIDGGAV